MLNFSVMRSCSQLKVNLVGLLCAELLFSWMLTLDWKNLLLVQLVGSVFMRWFVGTFWRRRISSICCIDISSPLPVFTLSLMSVTSFSLMKFSRMNFFLSFCITRSLFSICTCSSLRELLRWFISSLIFLFSLKRLQVCDLKQSSQLLSFHIQSSVFFCAMAWFSCSTIFSVYARIYSIQPFTRENTSFQWFSKRRVMCQSMVSMMLCIRRKCEPIAYYDSARVGRLVALSVSTKVRKAVAREDLMMPSRVGLLFLRRMAGKFYSMMVFLIQLMQQTIIATLHKTAPSQPRPPNSQRSNKS